MFDVDMNAKMEPAFSSVIQRKEQQEEESREKVTSIGEADPNDIPSVKRKYGEVWQVDVDLGGDDEVEGESISFIFRRPLAISFNRYLKTASKNMSSATANFVMDNLIDEHVPLFREKSKLYPGLALGVGQKLLAAIGLGDNINFKKL